MKKIKKVNAWAVTKDGEINTDVNTGFEIYPSKQMAEWYCTVSEVIVPVVLIFNVTKKEN